MKKLLLTGLVMIPLFFACRNESGQGQSQQAGETTSQAIDPTTVQLICQAVEEPNMEADAPRHEVFVQMGDSRVKVADILNCETLSPDLFAQYQIPAEALTAVGGWWAGAGDYLYIVQEGEKFVVKQGAMDEQQENLDYGYKTVMAFSKDGKEVF